jgi:hypothetical protein
MDVDVGEEAAMRIVGTRQAILVGLMAVLLAACGAQEPSNVALGGAGGETGGTEPAGGVVEDPAGGTQPAGGALGMCVEGATECVDMVVDPPDGECVVGSDAVVACTEDPGAGAGGGSPGYGGSGEVLCDGDKPTADAPAGTDCSAPAEPESRLVEPRGDGVQRLYPVGWDRHTAEGRRVTVYWYSGVEPCYVLAKVGVEEGPQRVVITLYEGTTDPDAICIEIAEAKRTTVRLAEPLGDRQVVDGAD